MYRSVSIPTLHVTRIFDICCSWTDDYQELSAREESDLEHMMTQTNNAISNIEAFTEQLSRDLSVLDGVSSYK